MSTTDTPRTNAKVAEMIRCNQSPDGLEYFARQLERELAEASTLLETSDGGRFVESQRQLGLALRHNEELRAELAAAQTILAQWKEFLQEVEVAEDRSNLDGDSAEVVLEQLNDGAEAMLKLTPDSVRNELAAAREALAALVESGDSLLSEHRYDQEYRDWDSAKEKHRAAIDAACAKERKP